MTDWRALEEADRRGLLPDNMKGALYEAQRRGLTGPTKGAARAQGKDLPLGERVRQGVGDIGQGAVQLINKLTGGALEANVPGGYDQVIANQQADYARRREEAGGGGGLPDFARVGGNALALMPAAVGAPAAKTLGGALAAGAAGGAAMGALEPVIDPNADYWDDKLGQVVTGAAIGAPTAGAGNLASRIVSPSVAPEVKALMQKGVTPTPGQILGGAANKFEQKLSSVPVVGDMMANARRRSMEDFNRVAINDALAPIGKDAGGKIGREGIEEAEKLIQAEYDRILPNVTFQADHQFVNDVANIRQLASFMPEQQFLQFQKVLTDKIGPRLSPTGTMDGQTFKGLESELRTIAKGYRKSQSFDDRELGSAIDELLGSMRANLERTNPMWAPQIAKTNQAWARFKRVQRAATYKGEEPGVFTPEQFQGAVKATDTSKDKAAYARGSAPMQELADAGRKVLGSNVPDSGTPGRIMAAVLGAGGAAKFVDPATLVASGALTLPYTKLGQRAMAAALTKRPLGSDLAAELIRRGTLPASIGAAGYGLPNQ